MHLHNNQAVPAEENTLRLVLAPIGWHDFEATNALIHEEEGQGAAYEKYIDMRTIQSGNMERGCRLSNILSNAVTIFTSDGKVGYQIRGRRQSTVAGLLTSSVDENIDRRKDDVDPKDPKKRLSSGPYSESDREGKSDYIPKGVPHPLAAVDRGIADEVSPRLKEYVRTFAIKVTGVAFGLDLLHPELLWIALVDAPAQTVANLRIDRPGMEVDEGDIKFVPASFGNRITRAVLERPDWHPAGKASFVRAIELIENFGPNARPADVFDFLAEAR